MPSEADATTATQAAKKARVRSISAHTQKDDAIIRAYNETVHQHYFLLLLFVPIYLINMDSVDGPGLMKKKYPTEKNNNTRKPPNPIRKTNASQLIEC